jgi:hypothetical protein
MAGEGAHDQHHHRHAEDPPPIVIAWDAAPVRLMAVGTRPRGGRLNYTIGMPAQSLIFRCPVWMLWRPSGIRSRRVCPLVCEHGSNADGERCAKINCSAGRELNDDNKCVKKQRPPAARGEPAPKLTKPKTKQVQSPPAKPKQPREKSCAIIKAADQSPRDAPSDRLEGILIYGQLRSKSATEGLSGSKSFFVYRWASCRWTSRGPVR